jgi:hypothetical protein
MLRTLQQREARRAAMRDDLAVKSRLEVDQADLLTPAEVASILRVSVSTARRLFRSEPEVVPLRTPGSHRSIMRIPRSVVDRILRRMANPPV